MKSSTIKVGIGNAGFMQTITIIYSKFKQMSTIYIYIRVLLNVIHSYEKK